jgi:hypothetical protein
MRVKLRMNAVCRSGVFVTISKSVCVKLIIGRRGWVGCVAPGFNRVGTHRNATNARQFNLQAIITGDVPEGDKSKDWLWSGYTFKGFGGYVK